MFVRRLLIKPAAFLDHLKGSERLLGLIIIIQLPRQIRDCEKQESRRHDDPQGAPVLQHVILCHVERSRLPSRSFMRRAGDISNCQGPEIPQLRCAPLGMTVI